MTLFFFFENNADYEIIWKNIVEPERPQMTKWRVRSSRKIAKATNSVKISNTYCFSTSTVVAGTHLTVTLYVHCLSCKRLPLDRFFQPNFCVVIAALPNFGVVPEIRSRPIPHPSP